MGHDFLDFFGDWWSCCCSWVDGGSGFGVLVVVVAARGDAERESYLEVGLIDIWFLQVVFIF